MPSLPSWLSWLNRVFASRTDCQSVLRRSKRRRPRRSTYRIWFEPLEDRFAPAAVYTWVGGNSGDPTNWNDGHNWTETGGTTGDYPGQAADAATVLFNTGAGTPANQPNLTATPANSIANITFQSGNLTISASAGASLTLTGGVTGNATAATLDTISAPITFGGAQTWNLSVNNTLTDNANITNGANLLTVNGAGNTSISGVVGNGAGGVTQGGTGTLILNANNTFTGAVAITSGTIQAGANTALGTNTGNVTMSTTSKIQLAGNITLANPIDMTVSGETIENVNGTNTLSGILFVDGGNPSTQTFMSDVQGTTLIISNFEGTAHTNKTLVFTGAGNISVSGPTTFTWGPTNGAYNVTKTGSGTLNVQTQIFIGWTAVDTVTVSGGSLLLSGNASLGCSTAGNFPTSPFTNNASLIFGTFTGGVATASSVISGNGTVTQLGAGTLTLSGTNSYSGGTNLGAGTIKITSDGNLGNSTGSLTFGGGNLALTGNESTARNITVNAAGAVTGSKALTISGNSTWTYNLGTVTGVSNPLLSVSGATFSVSAGQGVTITPAEGAGFGGSGTYDLLYYGTNTDPFSSLTLTAGQLTGYSYALVDNSSHSEIDLLVISTVNLTSTTTTVSSALNPSVTGQSVTFTAMVSGSGGTPTGVVTFLDGSSPLGTGTLNGSALVTLATISLGHGSSPHSITAVYGGDINFASSTSTVLLQIVNLANSGTTLTSSLGTTVVGQDVTFTATISAVSPGSGIVSGAATFLDGSSTLGTVAVSGGLATLGTANLSIGTHTITAVYGGDGNYAGSTAVNLTQTVNEAVASTAIASSANPLVLGQSVTFTATASATNGFPTGTVTFGDGGTSLGTGALSAGVPQWSTAPGMPTARDQLAAATGADGRIYTIGGVSPYSLNAGTVEAYTPGTQTWTSVAGIPSPRYGLAAVEGADGRIYAIGGISNQDYTNTVEAYTPGTNTWTTVASIPTGRYGLAAVEGADGRIYAIGGYTGAVYVNTVEAYTPGTNTWTTVASMPTALGYLAAVAGADGRIYAIGGENANSAVNTVEAYTPGTNTWTTVAGMPTVRYGLAAAVSADGRIYAIGGANNNGYLDLKQANACSPGGYPARCP